MTTADLTGELNWLLDDLIQRVGQISQAVVLSRDGLVMGAASGMTAQDADYLAALAAGLHSLALGAKPHLAVGEVRQTLVELDQGLFFVVPAGAGSCLALVSENGSNPGLVAYEMTALVTRVRHRLNARPRTGGAGFDVR